VEIENKNPLLTIFMIYSDTASQRNNGSLS